MMLKVTDVSELSLHGGMGGIMPIFAGRTLIKVGVDGTTISVINIVKDSKNATSLLGHEKPVSSLSISPNGSFVLCSCSEDRVILWNLFPLRYTHKETPMKKGLVVGEYIGKVLCCSFSWPLKWLVLCMEKELWIVLLKKNIFKSGVEDGFSLHRILRTDSKFIDTCSFSSQYPDIFVTVGDSNHFKVYNVASCEIIYRSTTVINNYINCCSFSGMPNKLLIGTNRGVARVYHLNEKFLPSPFMTVSLSEDSFLQDAGKYDDKEHVYQHTEEPINLDNNSMAKKECIIFSMKIYNRNMLLNESNITVPSDGPTLVAEKMYNSIICQRSILLICCSLGVIAYDCKSCEQICSISFTETQIFKMIPSEQLSSINNIAQEDESLDDFKCWMKTCSPNSKLYCVNFMFEELPIRNLGCGNIDTPYSANKDVPLDEYDLSFLPSIPISRKSPLLYCMKPHSKSLHALAQTDVAKKKNDKVKSSGYGTPPRKSMFIPNINESKKSKTLAKARKSISLNQAKQCCNGRNALKHGPPEKLVKDLLVCETNGTSMKLAFSVNGCHIACNSTPKELCILPVNAMCMEKSIIIPGHNSSITSLNFNLNSKWLLSSSTDSTVKIWDWRSRKCILQISFEGKLVSKSSHTINPVTQAGFFYLDKFILVATKGQMHLFSYLPNETTSYHTWLEQGTSRKIKAIDFETQNVNCFSAANQFHTSYLCMICLNSSVMALKDLVLAGCSNRNIMVYDFNHQRMARVFKDAHIQHPPHCLVQQTGSVCPSVPALAPKAYNLFLSAAMGDGVKLWDLRTPRYIQKYNQPINRMYAVGMDFSPCSRFVAVCSEDKRVYLYDTRNCDNYLGHLKGFSDIPMDVAFSPCMTQLVASTLNGHLFTFTHSANRLVNNSYHNTNMTY